MRHVPVVSEEVYVVMPKGERRVAIVRGMHMNDNDELCALVELRGVASRVSVPVRELEEATP